MAGRHLLGIHLHLRCMTWVVPLVILFRPTPAKRNNPRAAYVPITNRELDLPLIAARNHPNGTGDRLLRGAHGISQCSPHKWLSCGDRSRLLGG